MIFFLYGEDTYRSRQKLQQLKAKFQKEIDARGFNMEELDASNKSFAELKSFLLSSPFLVKKRLIVLKNILKNKQEGVQEKVEELLSSKTLEHIVVFFEEGDLDKRKKKGLIGFLQKQDFAQEFSLLQDQELDHFLIQYASSLQIKFEQPALRQFVSCVGSDLWKATSELHKIASFVLGSHRDTITREDVQLFLTTPAQDTIFQFLDAVLGKQEKVALDILEDLTTQETHPLVMVSMLSRQVKLFLLMKNRMQQQGPYAKLNIEGYHPFVVKKSMNLVGKYKEEELKNLYQQLLQVDRACKTSTVSPLMAMSLFIMRKSVVI